MLVPKQRLNMHAVIAKIFVILLFIAILALFIIFLPHNSLSGFLLSDVERSAFAEYASDRNITAMVKLRSHHIANTNDAMIMFYNIKIGEAYLQNTEDEYNNTDIDHTSNNENLILIGQSIAEDKHRMQIFFDKNASARKQFMQDCNSDTFCANSYEYKYYGAKDK